jgi:hypothetical protein
MSARRPTLLYKRPTMRALRQGIPFLLLLLFLLLLPFLLQL